MIDDSTVLCLFTEDQEWRTSGVIDSSPRRATPRPHGLMEVEMRVVAVAVLIALAVFLSDRLVRVENQRSALMTGLCEIDHAAPRRMFECLSKAQTRASWFWYLYYDVSGHVPAGPLFHP